MPLSVRPTPYEVPAYSLTGDLLSYRTCGLQYRYQNRSNLPPAKPVQLWFGQFIHGVMEESFRRWKEGRVTFPWGDQELQPIVNLIIRRLSAHGIHFQRFQLLSIAIERAFAAVNTFGPILFPTITEAEVTLRGIRPMPLGTATIRQSNYYEVEGVVDVMTSVQLAAATDPNPIINAVLQSIAQQTYEVIVDYKGMRRPSVADPTHTSWKDHEHQVLTYAWLRAQQPGNPDVRSGILLYLNELVPGLEDMDRLYAEVFVTGTPTTHPLPAGSDLASLQEWNKLRPQWVRILNDWPDAVRDWFKEGRDQGAHFPRMPALPGMLSDQYRKDRASRIIPVDPAHINNSLQEFDSIVAQIETSVARESDGVPIPLTWEARPREETCTVCDFKTFCPKSAHRGAPSAP